MKLSKDIELISTSTLDAKNTGTCWHLTEEECCGMPLVNNGKFKWCQNPKCVRNEISIEEWTLYMLKNTRTILFCQQEVHWFNYMAEKYEEED